MICRTPAGAQLMPQILFWKTNCQPTDVLNLFKYYFLFGDQPFIYDLVINLLFTQQQTTNTGSCSKRAKQPNYITVLHYVMLCLTI